MADVPDAKSSEIPAAGPDAATAVPVVAAPPVASATHGATGASEGGAAAGPLRTATVPKVAYAVPTYSGPFKTPVRAIYSDRDLRAFLDSDTCLNFRRFVSALNDGVRNVRVSMSYPVSPVIEALVAMLLQLQAWVDEIPPIQQPMRFGNKAFRTWHNKFDENALELLKAIIPEHLADARAEVKSYLVASFGHPVRMDYGTGHENCFILFLFCLFRLGLLTNDDYAAVVLRVFERYMRVVRKLQTVYWLEPAGSKGVWSLDDYQLLVFVFGSSQLSDMAKLSPRCIHQDDVLEHFASEFLYFQAILFIKHVKAGGAFAEHSPKLTDLSNLKTWRTINNQLMDMYSREVLEKFPVAQHLLFGSLLACTWTPTPAPQSDSRAPTAGEAIAAGVSGSWVKRTPDSIDGAPWAATSTGAISIDAAPWATGGASRPMDTDAAPWVSSGRPISIDAAPWARGASGGMNIDAAPWAVNAGASAGRPISMDAAPWATEAPLHARAARPMPHVESMEPAAASAAAPPGTAEKPPAP